MSMDAGVLRQRITLLRRCGVSHGGYAADNYEPFARVHARVRDESNAEFIQAESAQVSHRREFLIRYRADIPTDCRIEYAGETYELTNADGYTGTRDYLRLYGRRVSAKGTV